jgi:hypothetical protein
MKTAENEAADLPMKSRENTSANCHFAIDLTGTIWIIQILSFPHSAFEAETSRFRIHSTEQKVRNRQFLRFVLPWKPQRIQRRFSDHQEKPEDRKDIQAEGKA